MLIVLSRQGPSCHIQGNLPDPACTPGVADPAVTQANIQSTICVPGYTATVRPPTSYTSKVEPDLMARYGLGGSPADYELDHFISLELGGAPADTGNLWPEAYVGPWGARTKDRLENRLHMLVCSGILPLKDAQICVVQDWVACYRKYVLN